MRNLSLDEKHAAVKMVVFDKIKVKEVAKHFDCGKTQIYNALKNIESIEENIHYSKNSGKKKKIRAEHNEGLNDKVYDWYCATKAQNLPVNGPMLQQKAMEIAQSLQLDKFRASNGWLDSFRKNRQISFKAQCEETSENIEIATQSDIEDKTRDYDMRNIANIDETGLFFRALPNEVTNLKGKTCHGGKMPKERITMLLTVFGDGTIAKPLVIGKNNKPRCFKNINKNELPVIYKHNSKALMTAQIFTEYLNNLNRQMMQEKRTILLFLDNASCHPKMKLSNINLAFLPQNSKTVLQPLNKGIIDSVKVNYRKIMLQKVISLMNSFKSEIITKINVLEAIMMLSKAVNEVTSTCILKGFRDCGFPVESNEFPKINLNMREIENLLQNSNFVCSDSLPINATEYLAIDENLITETDCSDTEKLFSLTDNDLDSDSSSDAELKPIVDVKELFLNLSTLKNYAKINNNFSVYEKLEDIQFEMEKELTNPKTTKKHTSSKDEDSSFSQHFHSVKPRNSYPPKSCSNSRKRKITNKFEFCHVSSYDIKLS